MPVIGEDLLGARITGYKTISFSISGFAGRAKSSSGREGDFFIPFTKVKSIVFDDAPHNDEDKPISEAKANATGNKVIITGQLVKKDGSPITYGRVEVNEWVEEGNKFRFRVGEGGIYLNPRCKVDDEGRFKLELDLDLFEGAEAFAILAHLSPMSTQDVPLRDPNGNLIVFEFSEGAKNLDLGQIVVE